MVHRWFALLVIAAVSPLAAQSFNDEAARTLVDRAIARRQQAFADSTLRSYTAKAHGLVTFRAEFGDDRDRAGRALKADEIAVEVYWQRPDRSKQIIHAWRDSTLFPIELSYHRDHLGIVTDDFGPLIRIGDGDEVANVIHPLAPDGPALYDYRLGDTLAINSPTGRVVLISLEVKPKDPGAPRVIGVLFIDRDRAQVVRSRLTFTPAAYLDGQLEDITVNLERSLVEGRYWLPYRQAIEIRRRSGVIDFPLRGVIRGDWEIGDYQLNEGGEPPAWTGPSIGGLRKPTPGGDWPTSFQTLIDSTLAPPSRHDMERVRAAAVRLSRARLLDGLPRIRPTVGRISDVLRFNRVQGLALGGGVSWRTRSLGRLLLSAGYGTSDHRLTGGFGATETIGSVEWTIAVERTVADAGSFPARSLVVNSLAAQEWGSDLADYVRIDRIGLTIGGPIGAARVTGSLRRERPHSVEAIAAPARGELRTNPLLGGPAQWSVGASAAVNADRSTGLGSSITVDLEVGVGGARYGRFLAFGHTATKAGPGTLALRGGLGLASGGLPAWRAFAIGGAGTLVGQPFRRFGGRRAGWLATEWLVGIPAPTIPLGALGKTGSRVQVGPLVAFGAAGGKMNESPWVPSDRISVTLGGALELFDRAIRIEVGRSVSGGRGFGVSVDLNRAWWPIL